MQGKKVKTHRDNESQKAQWMEEGNGGREEGKKKRLGEIQRQRRNQTTVISRNIRIINIMQIIDGKVFKEIHSKFLRLYSKSRHVKEAVDVSISGESVKLSNKTERGILYALKFSLSFRRKVTEKDGTVEDFGFNVSPVNSKKLVGIQFSLITKAEENFHAASAVRDEIIAMSLKREIVIESDAKEFRTASRGDAAVRESNRFREVFMAINVQVLCLIRIYFNFPVGSPVINYVIIRNEKARSKSLALRRSPAANVIGKLTEANAMIVRLRNGGDEGDEEDGTEDSSLRNSCPRVERIAEMIVMSHVESSFSNVRVHPARDRAGKTKVNKTSDECWVPDSVKGSFNIKEERGDMIFPGIGDADVLPESNDLIMSGVMFTVGTLIVSKDVVIFKVGDDTIGNEIFEDLECSRRKVNRAVIFRIRSIFMWFRKHAYV